MEQLAGHRLRKDRKTAKLAPYCHRASSRLYLIPTPARVLRRILAGNRRQWDEAAEFFFC